jgi:hypothetical protein
VHGGIAECELLGIGGEACLRGGDEFLLEDVGESAGASNDRVAWVSRKAGILILPDVGVGSNRGRRAM